MCLRWHKLHLLPSPCARPGHLRLGMVYRPAPRPPAAIPTARPLQALQLDRLVGRQWSIVACSAVDGSGLLEGFDWLVKDIAARIYLLD